MGVRSSSAQHSVRGEELRGWFFLVSFVLLLGETGYGETVDEVVRSYLKARGGLERLRAVKSLRLSGTLELPGLRAAPFVLEIARPARMRSEIGLAGHVAIRAYDGRTAWSESFLPGEAPRPMGADEAEEARAQADVDLSPLVDARAKGYTVELAGRDRLPSGEAWRLLVRRSGEGARTLYLDRRSGLVVRGEEARTLEGRAVEFVTELGDYRPAHGIVFPHRIEVGPKGSPERQLLLIHSVEVNPELGDDRFSMPRVPGPSPGSAPPVPEQRAPAVLP